MPHLAPHTGTPFNFKWEYKLRSTRMNFHKIFAVNKGNATRKFYKHNELKRVMNRAMPRNLSTFSSWFFVVVLKLSTSYLLTAHQITHTLRGGSSNHFVIFKQQALNIWDPPFTINMFPAWWWKRNEPWSAMQLRYIQCVTEKMSF